MAKREHRYRITVEHIATPHAGEPLHPPLVFEAGNHDEILGIVARNQARGPFDRETTAALMVGWRLFGEVVLLNRKHPLFVDIREALSAFREKWMTRGEAPSATGDRSGDSVP
jgi:hypothetical protein